MTKPTHHTGGDSGTDATNNPYHPPVNIVTGATDATQSTPVGKNHKDDVVINLQNMSAAEATAVLDDFFKQEGYKLERGRPNNGVYGIGSPIMRILFGAFVKRHKFKVLLTELTPAADKLSDWQISICKAMSGASGGLIGYQKHKQELLRLTARLTDYINQRVLSK